jgi:hypothetical protein
MRRRPATVHVRAAARPLWLKILVSDAADVLRPSTCVVCA